MALRRAPVMCRRRRPAISDPDTKLPDPGLRPWVFKSVTPHGIWAVVAGIAIVALGFAVAFLFVEPPPPSRLTIAAGGTSGAYHAFAQRYKAALARSDIELEVLETAGSVENLALLRDGKADVALLQGGVLEAEAEPALSSLGALFYEPLWLFYRDWQTRDRLLDFAGLRVAIGPDGSGGRALLARLFAANGLDAGRVQFSDLGGEAAVEALLADEVDAYGLVAAAEAPSVQRLLRTPGIRLVSFQRAAGYAQRFDFLSAVTLHEGAIDLGAELPRDDVALVASVANLAAGPSLHPALVAQLLHAVQMVHEPGGLFEDAGTFPAPMHLLLPLHEEARRYYDSGMPFLQRYLPFWVASFLDRMVVLLIPLLTLALPLLRVLPPLYTWRMRARVNRWYREVARVELDHAEGREDAQAALRRLDSIEAEVAGQHVGIAYADAVYALRLHIGYIRQRLDQAAT
jgi:TRAP transporter TAXI family solute receptor